MIGAGALPEQKGPAGAVGTGPGDLGGDLSASYPGWGRGVAPSAAAEDIAPPVPFLGAAELVTSRGANDGGAMIEGVPGPQADPGVASFGTRQLSPGVAGI